MKNTQRLFYVFLFTLMGFSAWAQPKLIEKVEKKDGELVIPYEKWQLPNGLTVLLHEDHSDPIVHIEVTYQVGSSRESLGKSGFAHFFEHMMFQGSEHVDDEEHFKLVSEAGGNMNGTTNRDRTNYFETMPSNQLEVGLWLEADRMGFLLDAVTQKKFEVQRATVKNEKSQGDNQPYGKVYQIMSETLYPAGHPYSWPTIGYVEDLDRVGVEDLKNFFMRWYGPNNAILTVAGDINPEETLKLIEKYYGPIPKGPAVRKMRPNVPSLPVDRYANYGDNIFLPLTLMVFPTVPNYHPDEAPLDILSTIMGGGNNSIFYQNFVKNEKAIAANVSNPCYQMSGEFTVNIFSYPGQTFQEVENNIRATIEEFGKQGVTEEQVARAIATYETSFINSLQSVSGKASQLTQWQMLIGRSYNLDKELARYRKVTKDDVIRVFNQYIKGRKAAVINVFRKPPEEEPEKEKASSGTAVSENTGSSELEYKGLSYTKPKDNFDRSVKPTPGNPKAAVIPKYYTSKMDNGLRVIGTENAEVPMVSLLLTIRGTNLQQANYSGKIGVAGLTAAILNEGTQAYTTEEISAKLEKLGANISFNAGSDNTTVFVQVLKKNLDPTLVLLEEALLRPGFREDDFKRVKKQYLENVKNQRTSPNVTANKVFNRKLYGNTILGEYFTGTDKSISKVKLDDVKEFYQNYYSPSIASLVVVGNITEAEVLPKLAFLNKWEAKQVAAPVIDKSKFPEIEKTTIYLVHKPYAPQSQILIGTRAMPYDATGEYYRANIMNFQFGGNFNSRINLNIREDKGYSYGVRSFFNGDEHTGSWAMGGGVRTSATDSAMREFMGELKKFRAEGITDEELEFTRSALVQSDALSYETSFQKAGFLNQIMRYNLPADYKAQQENILKAITKDQVNQLAKQYLPADDKLVIVIVGNKYKVKKKLEKLGYGKVVEVDAEGK